MLSLESPRLHAIAADLHNAPAPRVILAGIQKKPPALIVPALAQRPHLVRCDELTGAQR